MLSDIINHSNANFISNAFLMSKFIFVFTIKEIKSPVNVVNHPSDLEKEYPLAFYWDRNTWGNFSGMYCSLCHSPDF